MGQLPELRAPILCHVIFSLETSGILSQHQRQEHGPQQTFELIRQISRAYETNTRHSLQASPSSNYSISSTARYPFPFFHVICCVIQRALLCFKFPASASAGPNLYLRFFNRLFGRFKILAFIQDRQPHGNGIGEKKIGLFCLFSISNVVLRGAPDLEVVRSRESVRKPGVRLPRHCVLAGW